MRNERRDLVDRFGEVFDFDIEEPRLVTDLEPDDVAASFDDERAFLHANPWTEPRQYLDRVRPFAPRGMYPDLAGALLASAWK